MRPGCCCCTPKAKVSTLSQATHHLQPAYLYTCISISSAIRYYPEICRRYSAPTNPSVTIICFRYRSTEPAMAAPASIGHSRIRYCKCRARLGPGAGRSPLVSWSRDLRQWPHAPSRGWSTLHTLLQVGIIAHCMALSSRQCAKQWHLMCLEKM